MNSGAEDSDSEVVITATRRIERYSLHDASELSGLQVERILEVTRAALVPGTAGSSAEPEFDARGITRLRQIAELVERQGLGIETMSAIAGLMDRLERAEAELRFLRERLRVD